VASVITELHPFHCPPSGSHLANVNHACAGKQGVEPGRRGSHWQELGFQGDDPATDLRGCGMLGLLQVSVGRVVSIYSQTWEK
jgi:hypothetical protein